MKIDLNKTSICCFFDTFCPFRRPYIIGKTKRAKKKCIEKCRFEIIKKAKLKHQFLYINVDLILFCNIHLYGLSVRVYE